MDVEALRRDLQRRMIEAVAPIEEIERTARAVTTIAKAIEGLSAAAPHSDNGIRNEGLRVRVLDGDLVVRSWETSSAAAIYETSAVGADFPGGHGPDVRIAVAQAGEVFGWGVEAVAALPV